MGLIDRFHKIRRNHLGMGSKLFGGPVVRIVRFIFHSFYNHDIPSFIDDIDDFYKSRNYIFIKILLCERDNWHKCKKKKVLNNQLLLK